MLYGVLYLRQRFKRSAPTANDSHTLSAGSVHVAGYGTTGTDVQYIFRIVDFVVEGMLSRISCSDIEAVAASSAHAEEGDHPAQLA